MDKRNVTQQVFVFLQKKLMEGAWPVGSKIPSEKELCEATGASRTSVRSALQQMNSLGIFETRHGSGTYVIAFNSEIFEKERQLNSVTGEKEISRLREWVDARFVLEPRIAYCVAERATPEIIKKLERLNEEQRAAVGNPTAFVKKDAEFHLALFEALGNRYLTTIMQELLNLEDAFLITNQVLGYHGGVYYHAAITDAIKSHDPKKAMKLMEEHAKNRFEIL